MKVLFASLLLLAGALFFAPTTRVVEAAPEKDVVDTAVSAGQFKTLAIALDKAGLIETLKGKGPFTVFAPTDAAFAKIPEETLKAVLADKEKLTKILMAHVVVGKKVMASDVTKMDGEKVNGFTISTKNGVKIGSSTVTKADIVCSNGVIHVIDTVLMPE